MNWSNFVNRLEITSRRRRLAIAVVYGFSLAVRFTSAAGEEVELPAQSVQRIKPIMSIMTAASPRLPYEDWTPNDQPIVSAPAGRWVRQAAAWACEPSMPLPSIQHCLRP